MTETIRLTATQVNLADEEKMVTFKYKDIDSKQWRNSTIPAEGFIRNSMTILGQADHNLP